IRFALSCAGAPGPLPERKISAVLANATRSLERRQRRNDDGRLRKLPSRARRLRSLTLLIYKIISIRTLEIIDMAVIEVPNAGRNLVEQIVVVRHQQHRSFVSLQRDI